LRQTAGVAQAGVHPETPDVTLLFPYQKAGIFCTGKKIKELRGDVLLYVAQTRPKIDAASAEKHPFRPETSYAEDLTIEEREKAI